MAVIPLKQLVTIERYELDLEWGEPSAEPVLIELKARVDESIKIVKNVQGEEVASSIQVLFDKLADVRYDDYLNYTNELGQKFREQPLAITPIRWYS